MAVVAGDQPGDRRRVRCRRTRWASSAARRQRQRRRRRRADERRTGRPGRRRASADFDSLIDLIVSTVEHDSWMENGTGEGEIQPFPTNLSLVISQTQRVHEQIADLLEQLRRLQDLQVTIEVRFIRLTDNFFERIGVDFDFNIEDGTGLSTNPAVPGALAPGAVFEPHARSATVGIQSATGLAELPELHGRPRPAVPAGQLRPGGAAVRPFAAAGRARSASRSSATSKRSS